MPKNPSVSSNSAKIRVDTKFGTRNFVETFFKSFGNKHTVQCFVANSKFSDIHQNVAAFF
jgi:hypothetical protein